MVFRQQGHYRIFSYLAVGLEPFGFGKIHLYFFIPIFEFAGAVMLPVIIPGLLYYLLNLLLTFLKEKDSSGFLRFP